jgi:hypothetical protein
MYLCMGMICLGLLYSLLYKYSFLAFEVMVSNNTCLSGYELALYYYYINLMELASFFFVRTRSSIKYLPKFLTLSNLMFLIYLSQSDLPHFRLAFKTLLGMSGFIYTYFIINYELPAMTRWPKWCQYTPML